LQVWALPIPVGPSERTATATPPERFTEPETRPPPVEQATPAVVPAAALNPQPSTLDRNH